MNRLQNIIKELKQGSNLELVNENFSNETILNQSVQFSILGDITFFKVDFRNVDFIGSHVMAYNFKDCNFINIDLTTSNFYNFIFVETKFKSSKLDFIGVSSMKVLRSRHFIEIEESFNLEKILKDMNLMISIDQDEIENF